MAAVLDSSAFCSSRHSWHIGSDSGVESAPSLFPVDIWHQADARLWVSGYENPFCYIADLWHAIGFDWIWLDLFNDDTRPSGHISRSGMPWQNCGNHYDLGCLATWRLLCFRSGAAFVNGDVTGTKVGPFLLNYNFQSRVGDCLGIISGGVSRALNPVRLDWRQASTWASSACKVCLWGHVGLRDRRSARLSLRGGVVGTSHRCGVLNTN